ncbi:hypothetical protein GHT06_017822 [Daphnia sinensis]|uniref:E3 ubiquitin-protein ligase APD1-4 middle domain-containing protein n=1 Tax=Daphnia sinensis TaxID=1820382 RepID=A0AAD5KMU4_9CRUS|nr:hypothetical protein GHT06_017822 [Daphnia sinensis]
MEESTYSIPDDRFSYQSTDDYNYNYRQSLNMSFSFGDYNLESAKYQYDALPVNNSSGNARCSLVNSTAAKILHLIIFGILLPTLFIVIPVYAKYVLYADTVVTFGASDMRLMDGHVSTSWCKSQHIQMNTSFDAYLMADRPTVTPKAQTLTMTREFELDDDLKEFWGFYLLKGSEVTVSSCARYLGANVMLIKGINSLKFCAYVGRESKEDESNEILGLESHKLAEQYQMETDDFKAPAPALFKQPAKKDKARILQLLKSHNEKRRLIKLLEKKNINSDRNDTQLPTEVVIKVEKALQKILQQEIESLYQEVKNIIATNHTKPMNNTSLNRSKQKMAKNRWPLKPLDNKGAKLSAVINEEVDSEEDGAYELDEDAILSLNITADGIADDRGTINHNHLNDTSESNESSFSSSEEAMLHCKGVILSQPLVPENQCSNDVAPRYNNIKYTVEEEGYYYFIFSSANEKVRNKLSVKFDLLKTVFNLTEATDVCHNSTSCNFPLSFYSSEKVVVSIPVPNSSVSQDWDRTFVARGVCEPRMPLYLTFVLLVPLFLVFCAFR